MSSNQTICTSGSFMLLMCFTPKSQKCIFKSASYRKVLQKQCSQLIISYLFQHIVLNFELLFELNRIANMFLLENFKSQNEEKCIKVVYNWNSTSYNLTYCITFVLNKLTNFPKKWNEYSYVHFRENVPQ